MKKVVFLIFTYLLVSSSLLAQVINDSFTYWANYYPFNNGMQMVEIVFGVKDYNIYQYELRAMPWHVNDPNPTAYLFRDINGKVLKSYNLCGTSINEFELLPPLVVNPKIIKQHKNSRYSIVENCEPDSNAKKNNWDIGGKYADANLTKAKYGLIDTMGNIILTPVYQELWVATKENIVVAKLNSKYGLLDENGKVVLPFVYDEMKCYSYNGGTFSLTRKNKYSYADSTGKIFSKREYDFGENFWSYRARVAIKDKFGFIDSAGNEVVPLVYERAEPFYYNVAVVGNGKKYGMINNMGEFIEPVEYDRIVDIYEEKEMVTTGYIGYKNEIPTYFNREGKRVSAPKKKMTN
jgi:hypothetical protein